MDSYFNFIFSSTFLYYLSIIIFGGSGLLVITIWRVPYSKDYKVIRALIALVPLMSSVPIHGIIHIGGKYNKVETISEIKYIDNKIVFWDKLYRSTRRPSSEWNVCRIFIVNPENGELLNRTKIGNNAVNELFFENKILIQESKFEDKNYLIFNVETYEVDKNLTNIEKFRSRYNNDLISKSPDKYLIEYNDNTIVCTEIETQIKKWAIKTNDLKIKKEHTPTNFLQVDEKFIFSAQKTLFCLNIETGDLIWKKNNY